MNSLKWRNHSFSCAPPLILSLLEMSLLVVGSYDLLPSVQDKRCQGVCISRKC